MKCPYCGAEVQANSKCEYCGSFVDANANEKNEERAQEIINKRLLSAHRSIIKMVILAAIILTAIPMTAGLFASIRLSDRITSEYTMSDSAPDTDSNKPTVLKSATDIYGNVSDYNYDGSITVKYDGGICETELTDTELLQWLNDMGRSIKGIDVVFSTDSAGKIDKIALSSETFFILDKQDSNYVILRGNGFFNASADMDLEQGGFYTGYFNYPNLNIHIASPDSTLNMMLYAPTCKEKREITVSDSYTGEEISCCQILIDSYWYYCSREFYDNCEEDSIIEGDIYKDSQRYIVYQSYP